MIWLCWDINTEVAIIALDSMPFNSVHQNMPRYQIALKSDKGGWGGGWWCMVKQSLKCCGSHNFFFSPKCSKSIPNHLLTSEKCICIFNGGHFENGGHLGNFKMDYTPYGHPPPLSKFHFDWLTRYLKLLRTVSRLRIRKIMVIWNILWPSKPILWSINLWNLNYICHWIHILMKM